MMKDADIPVLSDLIEENIEITQPKLGLDVDQDLLIDTDDDPFIDFESFSEKPALEQEPTSLAAIDPELEQSIKRILDEHMELAWQEIRLAIQLSHNDKD